MKRVNVIRAFAILFATVVAATGCNLLFPGPELPVVESPSGNLVIANDSGQDLGLFVDGSFVTGVPADRPELVVEIQISGTQEEKELRLYKAGDVEDLNEPDSTALYRSWNVVLTADSSLAKRRTWRIGGDSPESSSEAGTLTLRYGSGSDDFVRVYAGGLSGSRIATLSAQAGEAVVGLDYGTYELTYEYVYDDGQGTGATVVGTIDRESVMSESVPIYVVLNSIRDNHTKQIPHFGAANDTLPAPYGTLSVTNTTATPVSIWVDGQLVEEIAYIGDGSRDNASTVASSATIDYVIAAGSHLVRATSITGTTLAELTVTVPEDGTHQWTVTNP